MKKFLLLIIALYVLVNLTACSSPPSAAESYTNESPEQIYSHGVQELRSKNYSEAVKRFEAVEVQYPFGPQTENAQLFLIYAYYMKEDYALSAAEADRFIKLHPRSPHVDYAYYMRGKADYYQNMGVLERLFSVDLATRDLTQMQKSYRDFDELTTRFSQSPYAPSAYQYKIYLRNVMADHELHIAQHYFDRKAFIAAANRASGVVMNYQGSPKVIDALVLMAKSYNKLGLVQQEQDTLAVLHTNFPYIKV